MNRTYSIVYNAALGEYQVASEKTKTRRSKARKLLPIILASLLAPALAVDINDGENAVNVSAHSTAQWADYIFDTKNPVDINNGIEQFGFVAWKTTLDAYVKDPNNSTKKSAWEDANQALKDNVAKYFLANKGFLNIDQYKTFTLTASTTKPTEKLISKDGLVAISVGAGKNLTYELNNPLATSDPKDEPVHTSRLFNIEKDGTLIMTGEKGSSIIIKGFKVYVINTQAYGGAIYNKGNVLLGDNVTFEGNTASSSPSSSSVGGAIYNKGTFSLGDNAKFENNTVSSSSLSVGGAIYNEETFSIGDNVKFESNTVFSFSSYSFGGAIYNNAGGTFNLGAGAQFIKNEAQTTGRDAVGGAIANYKTFNLATGDINNATLFTGNLANGKANSIHQNGGGEFNITGDGILDMRDPFSGIGTFSKSGKSVWKLGGDNTTTNININEGTLYLYAKDEVDNGNSLDAKAKVGLGNLALKGTFTLGSGAALSLGGQGHTINADSVDIQKDTNIRLNLHGAQANNIPIVKFDITNSPQNFLDESKIDIHTLAKYKGVTYAVKCRHFNLGDFHYAA